MEKAAFEQTRSVFSSLEIGMSRTLQHGEMVSFHSLLDELGKLPNVSEISLANPRGQIDFSSRMGSIDTTVDVHKALEGKGRVHENREGESLLLARAVVLETKSAATRGPRRGRSPAASSSATT